MLSGFLEKNGQSPQCLERTLYCFILICTHSVCVCVLCVFSYVGVHVCTGGGQRLIVGVFFD